MTTNTPEYLAQEVFEKYGIEIPLDVVISYLDSDSYLTPETLFRYFSDDYLCNTEDIGEVRRLPKGFSVVDFSSHCTIPCENGIYIWLLKPESSFPLLDGMEKPIFNLVEVEQSKHRVLYVGKASNLYSRIWRTHINGVVARSTLRKSLAALFEFKFEKYMSGNTLKTRINEDCEEYITQWLQKNCIILYKKYQDIEKAEEKMIGLLDPPLNIDKNPNIHNGIYVAQLSALRKVGGYKTSTYGSSKKKLLDVLEKLFVGKVFKGTIFEEEKAMIWFGLALSAFLIYTFIVYS